MNSEISGVKRRRITIPPKLENVKSLSGDTSRDNAAAAGTATFAIAGQEDKIDAGQGLPTFILNALIGEEKMIEHEACPFKKYIDLKQKAWGGQEESQYLIFRKSYDDLVLFLANQFCEWKSDENIARVVAGTAGIGKTMFALLLARKLFKEGMTVLLYYENDFWAFTKKLRNGTKEFLDKEIDVGVGGTKIYFTFGTDTEDIRRLNDILQRPAVFTLRDCGRYGMKWLGLAAGRIIYFASSGQEEFLGMIQNKLGTPPRALLRNADLWSAIECVWAAKLGLLQGFGNGSLDIEYILEGYRRFGGSVRNVLLFARELKGAAVAVDKVMEYQLLGYITSKIQIIVDMQNSNQVEKSKAKAMVFHRSPVDNAQGYRVHFASTYMQELVMNATNADKDKVLNMMVAALSLSGGKQSAYGTLYEEEFHRAMFGMKAGESKSTTLHLLGSHSPNAKKVKGMVAKGKPTLDFARPSVLHFPGKSLANARLKSTDDPLFTYFHPLTSNFPTHDSFMVCKASCFFEACTASTKKYQKEMEHKLAHSVVLVGLQQTVSGSDDASDKPSHSVVGQHLKDHYEDFKHILQQYHPRMNVLEEVVTVFVSPTESCRKMKFMPVLTKESNKALQTAIPKFSGTAVQYYAVFEVECIQN